MKERRRYERFSLSLPAKIEVVDPPEEMNSFRLWTGNVSAGGAFFYTKEPIAKGIRVRVRLTIQSDTLENITGAKGHVMLGGEVVRSGATGMAIRFQEKFQFLSLRSS